MKKYFVVLLFILLFALPVGVLAHAELRSAVPEPGATLTEQPGEIRLTFNETVGPGSTIRLFGEAFREVEGVETMVDPDTPVELAATVPDLAAGTYSVDWTVISADGHPATGSYTFAVLPGAGNGYIVGVLLGTLAAAVVMGVGIRLLKRYCEKKE